MEHAPGPWRFCDCGKCGLVWSIPADDVVADVTLTSESGEWTPEVRAASARLIAAAPDLLEALEHEVGCRQCSQSGCEHCGGCTTAAAIAKATR